MNNSFKLQSQSSPRHANDPLQFHSHQDAKPVAFECTSCHSEEAAEAARELGLTLPMIQNPNADLSATSVLVVPSAIIVTVTLALPLGKGCFFVVDALLGVDPKTVVSSVVV